MWRLTDEAIREGVKSTTRYRTKLPNKRGRVSQLPQPQRQASGARGSQTAKRTARLRRSERGRGGPGAGGSGGASQAARSVPNYNTALDRLSPWEMPLPHPPSPYYSSELDFGQPSTPESFVSSYSVGSVGSHAVYPDQAFMLPCSPDEPLFYSEGSPSTSGDDPMTPSSVDGDWPFGLTIDMPETYGTDDIDSSYQH